MNKLGKRIAGMLLAAGVALSLFVATPVTSMAYTTSGKVISDNVKVRESASTTAKQVSSLKNGDVVDIVDEATDASGYVWYKIFVNKSEYGYVRSDLVSKSGSSSSSSTTTSTSTSTTTSTASLPETTVTATEQKNAVVTPDSVNVRKGAGTAYDSVGKVTKGQNVTITGEASGTDGKTWYQITFGDGKTGFVRNDLVTISDAVQVENPENTENTENAENAGGENTETPVEGEGENTENSQPATTTSDVQGDGKYKLVYQTEEDGTSTWYLYSYEEGGTGGYRVKVDDLIAAAQSADAVNNLRKQSDKYKTLAIILGIVAAILVAGIVVLVLKLRDSLYYEDEEEEEYDRYAQSRKRPSRDEEERPLRRADRGAEDDRRPRSRNAEDERPSRRPERTATEERTVRPTRRPQGEADERPVRRPERNAERDYERPSRRNAEDDRADERPSRRPAQDEDRPVRRSTEERRSAEVKEEAPKRRARNFVGDDDDFEFEFLDLDD